VPSCPVLPLLSKAGDRQEAGMKVTENTSDIEIAFIWGPWQKEIRETFSKARPIIEELAPEIDRRFIFYLLREQTWIAMNRSNRKIEQAWRNLCHALETFLSSAFGSRPLREIKQALEGAEKAGKEEGGKLKLWVQPEELAPKPSEDILKGLNTYADKLGLPTYKEVVSGNPGGRPPAGWSDDVAFAMQRHFSEKLGTPKRKFISKLLACAPVIESASMESEKIRQRLLKKKRQDKKILRQPTVAKLVAYNLERLYLQWVKAGAKGPCPSLLHPSSFRDPAFDTSLSEKAVTKLAVNLFKKYPRPEK
jgi:hypothetical protein